MVNLHCSCQQVLSAVSSDHVQTTITEIYFDTKEKSTFNDHEAKSEFIRNICFK